MLFWGRNSYRFPRLKSHRFPSHGLNSAAFELKSFHSNSSDPSLGQMYQKILKGPGMEERKAVIDRALVEFSKIFEGKEYEKEPLTEFYHHLALDVAREKKRIGGTFVIANIVMSAEIREHLR